MVTPKQTAKILTQIADSNITGPQFQALIESGEFTALLRKFTGQPTVETYKVMLDSSLNFVAMILAGKYDWVNDDITEEHFPLKINGSGDPYRGSSELELRLVHFARDMTTAEVHAELDKLGLRPANLQELCAFGAAHHELQRQFPIVALGSRWRLSDDGVDVPILRGDGRERRLDLRWDDPGNQWDDCCRFLAVSK